MQRSDVAVEPRGSSGAGRRRSTAAASEACPDWGIGPSGACDQVEKKAQIQPSRLSRERAHVLSDRPIGN